MEKVQMWTIPSRVMKVNGILSSTIVSRGLQILTHVVSIFFVPKCTNLWVFHLSTFNCLEFHLDLNSVDVDGCGESPRMSCGEWGTAMVGMKRLDLQRIVFRFRTMNEAFTRVECRSQLHFHKFGWWLFLWKILSSCQAWLWIKNWEVKVLHAEK